MCLFCNKSRKKVITKRKFLYNTLKKTPSSEKSLISTYSFLLGGRKKRGGFWLWALIEFEWKGEG